MRWHNFNALDTARPLGKDVLRQPQFGDLCAPTSERKAGANKTLKLTRAAISVSCGTKVLKSAGQLCLITSVSIDNLL
jgi:hypothetical protein